MSPPTSECVVRAGQLTCKRVRCARRHPQWGPVLGEGSFGAVHCVWWRGRLYACKCYRKAAVVDSRQGPHVARERGALLSMSHPLLVRLHATAQDVAALYLLLEYLPGSLAAGWVNRIKSIICMHSRRGRPLERAARRARAGGGRVRRRLRRCSRGVRSPGRAFLRGLLR